MWPPPLHPSPLPLPLQPTSSTPACAPCREGAAHETGFEVWDPVGLADLGSEQTLAWYRHAELKHGAPAPARAASTRPNYSPASAVERSMINSILLGYSTRCLRGRESCW